MVEILESLGEVKSCSAGHMRLKTRSYYLVERDVPDAAYIFHFVFSFKA